MQLKTKKIIVLLFLAPIICIGAPYCLYDISHGFFAEGVRCGDNELSSVMIYLSISSVLFFSPVFLLIIWRYPTNEKSYSKYKLDFISWSLVTPFFLFLTIAIIADGAYNFRNIFFLFLSISGLVFYIALALKLRNAKLNEGTN